MANLAAANYDNLTNDSLLLDTEDLSAIELDESDLNHIGITRLTQTLAIIGVCICVIGIIGNFFSIIVLNRKAMKKLSTYTYLLGLAVCDEISLTFTIMILLHYTVPTNVKYTKAFTFNTKILLIYIYPIVASTQALSVWITLAFTIDRYLFICHPYYGREFCTRRRAFIVLICLFLLAIVYSIPQYLERTFIIVDILNTKHVFQSYTALGRNQYFIYIYHLFVYCTFVFFIPITLIIVLNIFLVNDIIKSNKRHRELNLFRQSFEAETVAKKASIKNGTRTMKNSSIMAKPLKHIPKFNCLLTRCCRKANSSGEIIDMDATLSSEPCLDKSVLSKNPSGLESQLNISNALTVNGCNGKSGSSSVGLKSSISTNDGTLRNDVSIMLAGLILVFLICQLPSSILRLITFKNLSIYFQPIYYSSLDISNFLIVSNSTLNCILYVGLGKKFRKEFLKTFFPRCYTPDASLHI